MESTAEPHPESVNICLAGFLENRRTTIREEWVQRLRPSHPNGGQPLLETSTSMDLFALLDQLVVILRCSPSPLIFADAPCLPELEVKGEDEKVVAEVLCEIKHLRAILLYHLRTFEDLHPDYGMAALLFVSTIVHRFLDDVMIAFARRPPSARLAVH
jgi:hypothetical protein